MTATTTTASAPWELRAVQLDLARQMEKLDTIRAYADFAAEQGYNCLFLYLEGRVRSPGFPYRPAAESYSLEQMAAVAEHCAGLGLDLVPGIAALAHAEQFLVCPELAHLAEEQDRGRFGPGAAHTFSPSVPETYEFLDRYLGELAQVFTSEHLHVGLDEAWNLGFHPETRKRWERDGLGQVFHDHLVKLHQICAGHGKRMWFWDDMYEFFPEYLEQAPEDLVWCHWGYHAAVEPEGLQGHFRNRWRQDWLALHEELGNDVLICPRSLCARNIRSFTAYARRHQVLGGLLTQWEMSRRFLDGEMLAVAYCGRLWSQPEAAGDLDLWQRTVSSVLPALDVHALAPVVSLSRSARIEPRPERGGAIHGRLSAAEMDRAELVRQALEDLMMARDDGQYPPTDPRQAGICEDVETRAWLECIHWTLRELRPEITDPRRRSRDVSVLRDQLAAVRRQTELLRERRLTMEKERRDEVPPGDAISTYFAELLADLDRLAQALERAPDEEDWRLVLRLFLPDAHGAPRLRVSVPGADGDRELLCASLKPPVADGHPYYTRYVDFRGDAPARLRLEASGYGGQGIAFVEVQGPRAVLLPDAIAETTGPVEDADALLSDDTHAAWLGRRDILAQIHRPELADEPGVIVVDLQERGF